MDPPLILMPSLPLQLHVLWAEPLLTADCSACLNFWIWPVRLSSLELTDDEEGKDTGPGEGLGGLWVIFGETVEILRGVFCVCLCVGDHTLKL